MRRRAYFCLGLACSFVVLSGSVRAVRDDLKPTGKVTLPAIEEGSGIVKSRRYPNTYWVHNDSGDKARIFAIHEDGSIIVPRGLALKGQSEIDKYEGTRIEAAENYDWEDITTDGQNLYISDLGNNGNARRDLGIYVVREPNPQEIHHTRTLSWLPVEYEDQKQFPPTNRTFDCEAIFWLRGKLYAITKHRLGPILPAPSANLYRLDTTWTDKPNKLKKIDGANELGGWVTAADVSPDGKTLAVLTHAPVSSVWLFSTSAPGDKFLSAGKGRQIKFTGANQCEGLGWSDDHTLLITNEQRDIFKLRV